MARGRRYRPGTSKIVFLLVVAVCGYFILSSVQEKYGYDFGLPSFSLPGPEELLGELETPPAKEKPASSPLTLREDLEVHFLDVGQAESILILAPEKTVLIDAGENDQGDLVVRYLKEQGVSSIDLLIGTHPHSDHIGGMDVVLSKMPVETVILPMLPDELIPSTVTFTDLLKAIDEAGLEITPALPGDRYDLGGGALLAILGPLQDYDNLNSMSVVSRISFGSTSFLFTGDMEKDAERDLVKQEVPLASTVLSVGHHGSKTSSRQDFLEAVQPKLAVISCGLDNSYGHPHREVMERLDALGIRVLRTDLDGTVVLTSDGKTIEMEVAQNKIAA
ncbi:MAG: ComEC/Rec2 family competence protein [Oscillospiraceae bacterium]|jgi:competence protein ComEC